MTHSETIVTFHWSLSWERQVNNLEREVSIWFFFGHNIVVIGEPKNLFNDEIYIIMIFIIILESYFNTQSEFAMAERVVSKLIW